jgi:hypothetical protein
MAMASRVRSSEWIPYDNRRPAEGVSTEAKLAWTWDRWYATLLCSIRREAMDPRDYVYSLLGVSGADIMPDYSGKKSTGEI